MMIIEAKLLFEVLKIAAIGCLVSGALFSSVVMISRTVWFKSWWQISSMDFSSPVKKWQKRLAIAAAILIALGLVLPFFAIYVREVL